MKIDWKIKFDRDTDKLIFAYMLLWIGCLIWLDKLGYQKYEMSLTMVSLGILAIFAIGMMIKTGFLLRKTCLETAEVLRRQDENYRIVAEDYANALPLSFAVGRDREPDQPQMGTAIPPRMLVSPGIEFMNSYNDRQREILSQRQEAMVFGEPLITSRQPPQLPSLEDYHWALEEMAKLKDRIEENEKDITALTIENYELRHRTTNSIEGLDV